MTAYSVSEDSEAKKKKLEPRKGGGSLGLSGTFAAPFSGVPMLKSDEKLFTVLEEGGKVPLCYKQTQRK